MIGSFSINGIDAYQAFGVFISEGGLNGLVSFPELKEPNKNNWAELDGVEVDLSAPKLDTKELSISFGTKANADFNGFMELVFGSVYHDINFTYLGITNSLRFVSCPDYKGESLRLFSLNFADDFPLQGYSYVAPSSNLISQRGYKLDGVDLSQYGIAILEGSDSEISKPRTVKPNLTINVKSQSGARYDSGRLVFQEKEVKLNCLMLATNMSDFFKNRNALLYNLSKPGERVFNYSGVDYKCYYKSANTKKFSYDGKIWFEFELVIIFI